MPEFGYELQFNVVNILHTGGEGGAGHAAEYSAVRLQGGHRPRHQQSVARHEN